MSSSSDSLKSSHPPTNVMDVAMLLTGALKGNASIKNQSALEEIYPLTKQHIKIREKYGVISIDMTKVYNVFDKINGIDKKDLVLKSLVDIQALESTIVPEKPKRNLFQKIFGIGS